jgi:hypothetical protein
MFYAIFPNKKSCFSKSMGYRKPENSRAKLLSDQGISNNKN